MRYMIKRIRSSYWKPGTDYLEAVSKSVEKIVEDRDVIVVSEKAVSTSKGNLVDESKIKAGTFSKVIAKYWMRYLWGYFLGRICHLKAESILHLRNYPLEEGARHKQLTLRRAGLLQALKHGSEGGMDTSNLPYAYACLILENPTDDAQKILEKVRASTGKSITVIISDSDLTFTFHGLHLSTRGTSVEGIIPFGGALSFIAGRTLKLKQRATPVAIAGPVGVEEALELSEIAHHKRGYGAGRTVWDALTRFHAKFGEVTWKMLEKVDHYPIVIVRRA